MNISEFEQKTCELSPNGFGKVAETAFYGTHELFSKFMFFEKLVITNFLFTKFFNKVNKF